MHTHREDKVSLWRVAHFSNIINKLGAPFLAPFARSGALLLLRTHLIQLRSGAAQVLYACGAP